MAIKFRKEKGRYVIYYDTLQEYDFLYSLHEAGAYIIDDIDKNKIIIKDGYLKDFMKKRVNKWYKSILGLYKAFVLYMVNRFLDNIHKQYYT